MIYKNRKSKRNEEKLLEIKDRLNCIMNKIDCMLESFR